MSRCNLANTRIEEPAADVLIMGSSRTGVALDHLSMTEMFEAAGSDLTADRVVITSNPLRTHVGLLENYISNRGAPDVLAFEISFLVERTLDRIDARGSIGLPEDVIYRRDINLLTYGQILETSAAVARPFTEEESPSGRARLIAEGFARRSGALIYELAAPSEQGFTLEGCTRETVTREPGWPEALAFTWNDVAEPVAPAEHTEQAQEQITAEPDSELAEWQTEVANQGEFYNYDTLDPRRQGELLLLDEIVAIAEEHDIPVLLLPLNTFGTIVDPSDIEAFTERYASTSNEVSVFDLYTETGVDLTPYWFDDAHLSVGPATELTTAVMAQHVLDVQSQ